MVVIAGIQRQWRRQGDTNYKLPPGGHPTVKKAEIQFASKLSTLEAEPRTASAKQRGQVGDMALGGVRGSCVRGQRGAALRSSSTFAKSELRLLVSCNWWITLELIILTSDTMTLLLLRSSSAPFTLQQNRWTRPDSLTDLTPAKMSKSSDEW